MKPLGAAISTSITGVALLASSGAMAESAFVLPKGTWAVETKFQDYLPIDERFDPDGDKEAIAADFNTALDSQFLPSLQLVEQGFRLPSGSASLGDTIVDLEYDIKILELQLAYGLTDKLSIGAKIPYWWVRSKASARVDSSATSSATVGLNPLWGVRGDPFGTPVIPLAYGGVRATTEDIQDVLGPGLAINGTPAIPGYNYQRFEDWEGEGFADIELGARYQYWKSDQWLHAFTGGVRLPTGRGDDPDNLIDYRFGTGAYALLLRSHHDYLGLRNWVFNATFKLDLFLPYDEVRRVPEDPNLPLTLNKERVDVKVGDRFELDLWAKYNVTPAWSLGGRYRFSAKREDDIDGDLGFNYRALEEETDATEHIYQIYLAYSNLQKFRSKQASFPFEVDLSYRDRFAGTNNVLNSQFVQATVRVFF